MTPDLPPPELREPPVNAIMRRTDELLAAYDAKKGSGGGKLPESPYELLRESRHWIEELANLLATECQDNSGLRARIERLEAALRPFLGDPIMETLLWGDLPDDNMMMTITVRLGVYREARAALGKEG